MDGKRILIVDDAPSDLKVLSNVLHKEYAVSVATCGRDALQLAAEQQPDLILLDIIMPEMDGFMVIERLKEEDRTRDIPVIFLTVVDAVADKIRGFECGAVDYITKPFEPLEVRARVRTHLALEDALRRLVRQNSELLAAARLREDMEQVCRHDLKSPLNTIFAATDLLLIRDTLAADDRRYVETIQEAGLRMLEMINRYVDLFRIEHNRYVLHPKKVNILGLAQRTLKDLAGLFNGRRLRPVLESTGRILGQEDEGELFVRGEEMLCYSILLNLLRNAAEASPPDGVVAVRFARKSGQVVVTVENQGEVPAAMRDRFFEKYATEGKPHGTGLGTYAARLFVEVQGGSILLDSSVAGITRVEIRLPSWTDG